MTAPIAPTFAFEEGHPLCTCPFGRLCLTGHPTWEAFLADQKKHRAERPACTWCIGDRRIQEQIESNCGLSFRPGADSFYSKMRGF